MVQQTKRQCNARHVCQDVCRLSISKACTGDSKTLALNLGSIEGVLSNMQQVIVVMQIHETLCF